MGRDLEYPLGLFPGAMKGGKWRSLMCLDDPAPGVQPDHGDREEDEEHVDGVPSGSIEDEENGPPV